MKLIQEVVLLVLLSIAVVTIDSKYTGLITKTKQDTKIGYACEGMRVTLFCDSGVVNVLHAKYGFHNNNICSVEEMSAEYRSLVCYDTSATNVVADSCNGRTACILRVDSKMFKDPCPKGIFKQLDIAYNCV